MIEADLVQGPHHPGHASGTLFMGRIVAPVEEG